MGTNRKALAVIAASAIFSGALFPALPALAAPPAAAQASGPAEAGPVDINKATVQDLCSLPGIGPAKAEAIVAHRAKHGAFATVEDLLAVPGIGQRLLDLLAKQITVKPN